ncbi:MAG: NAD(P)-binding domain-containing protein [Deferribacteres bacterium]|nr:NAD(P)-binding domain-containing protein [candidate division KSB1 bacterium]MCB9502867.1 NAD(P)-binding domain-containing protein [Deferribacteres bacterium]
MYEQLIYVVSIAITIIIPVLYLRHHRTNEKIARSKLTKAKDTGRTEPVSLHPRIDPNRCINAGACVKACPEGDILGVINGKAELLEPTRCIGHGACQAACPVDAIDLVFGTERRGVEIPHVKETFETNVPGLYIAGELGGMGLIRNAVTQGREAVDYLAKNLDKYDQDVYDLAIIGAGPAGIASTLQAKKLGLKTITIEQDDIGGTVLNYPRQKLVMTKPMDIPIYGKFKAREIRKEELLALWNQVIASSDIHIKTHEKLEEVKRINGYFQIKSSKGTYQSQRIILAIGRRGTPRKLDIPGEQSAKVIYKLMEAEQYAGKRVLVVGGGDSAIEAALILAKQPGTEVTLSYRKNVLTRVKKKNEDLFNEAVTYAQILPLYESQVREIHADYVLIDHQGALQKLDNDFVFIMAGGELPTAFLQKLGIHIEMKFGER